MAHWDYTLSGGSSTVQVATGINIPTIPGSIVEDINRLKMSTPSYLSNFIKKLWRTDWYNKAYSTLPKLLTQGSYRVAYWWAGRYNRSVGNKTQILEIDIGNLSNTNKFYIGGFVYWNGLASHRGAGYYQYPLTMTATVTYLDNTSETFTLKSPYINITHDIGGWTSFHKIGKVYQTSKKIKHIKVISNYLNAGAEWHDIGDRGMNNGQYNNNFISNKGGYFYNQLFNIDYTNKFNLPYFNGSNIIEEVKTTYEV